MIFHRPHALFALLLALAPWLALIPPPRRTIPRVLFAPLAFLSTRRARKQRARRNILQAALLTVMIVALALLWSDPHLASSNELERKRPTTSGKTSLDKLNIIVVDAGERSNSNDPTLAECLRMALATNASAENVALVSYLEFATTNLSLERYNLVIVAELSSPNAKDLETLRRYLAREDGAVILWHGSDVDAQAWREAISKLTNIQLECLALKLDDDSTTNAKRLPRQETNAEKLFKDAFPDFEGARLDAPPLTRATVCYGDAYVVLRDAERQIPIFSQITPRLYWFAASTDRRCGALLAMPAFQALVENVALFPARYDAELQKKAGKRVDLQTYIWALLAVATLGYAVLVPNRDRRRAQTPKRSRQATNTRTS